MIAKFSSPATPGLVAPVGPSVPPTSTSALNSVPVASGFNRAQVLKEKAQYYKRIITRQQDPALLRAGGNAKLNAIHNSRRRMSYGSEPAPSSAGPRHKRRSSAVEVGLPLELDALAARTAVP